MAVPVIGYSRQEIMVYEPIVVRRCENWSLLKKNVEYGDSYGSRTNVYESMERRISVSDDTLCTRISAVAYLELYQRIQDNRRITIGKITSEISWSWK